MRTSLNVCVWLIDPHRCQYRVLFDSSKDGTYMQESESVVGVNAIPVWPVADTFVQVEGNILLFTVIYLGDINGR